MSPSSISVLLFLYVLNLLLCGAYGARLGKIKFGMKSSSSSFSDHQNSDLIMENSNVAKKNDNMNINNNVEKRKLITRVECKHEDDCGTKGKSRNLVTSINMSTHTSRPILKNKEINNGANKGMDLMTTKGNKGRKISSSSSMHRRSLSTPPVTDQGGHQEEVDPHKYQEDVIDMTEMDYSPAKRKPPIHN